MTATILFVIGLSFDIGGVLLLFVVTSSKYLEREFEVRLIETNWITFGEPDENKQYLFEARKVTDRIRRMQRGALTVIALGFLLQLIGHFV